VARSKSIKQEIREYLEAERPASITGAVWRMLLERLAPVSESYLRDLLRQTGLPFEQPYQGVRQHTFCAICLRRMRRPRAQAIATACGTAGAR
jgi:hypothetical protein